jgi:hypothetical protein
MIRRIGCLETALLVTLAGIALVLLGRTVPALDFLCALGYLWIPVGIFWLVTLPVVLIGWLMHRFRKIQPVRAPLTLPLRSLRRRQPHTAPKIVRPH